MQDDAAIADPDQSAEDALEKLKKQAAIGREVTKTGKQPEAHLGLINTWMRQGKDAKIADYVASLSSSVERNP